MMKNFGTILLIFLAFCWSGMQAQMAEKPSILEIDSSPEWVQLMYSEKPNVWEVESAYQNYYRNHSFEKNFNTQFYKRWRREIQDRIDDNGFVIPAKVLPNGMVFEENLPKTARTTGLNGWSPIGPYSMKDNSGASVAKHINIRAFAISPSDTTILFSGTEPGEIFKSTNSGDTWFSVSGNVVTNDAVTALAVHPNNSQIVLAGSGSNIFRSSDGGNSWTIVLSNSGLSPHEILFNPASSNLVFACTEKGLYRSTNGGLNFTSLYNERCFDMKWNTADPSKAYLLKDNPSAIICEFYSSLDSGATWTIQSNGWYNSNDPGRTDRGARLAVSNANPNRIYAYLIGEAKTNDVGFIGVYRSDDGGATWLLPNGPAGGPYSTAHPNLARGTTTWDYHQGFYNCAIMASNSNPDAILIGGLNLWRSNDAGQTFSVVSGYMPGPLSMHVDNQDFRANGNTYWITTDGGTYVSNDFFQTQPEVKMNGIHSADYWGFGMGWNEDVFVGGLYHNGNNVHHENYPNGDYLHLGGGEAATGYINPGLNRQTYFSDIGGKKIPLSITGTISGIPFGLSPNESYYAAESSELEFHPNCYNIAYLGREHKLWKTTDGGGNFSLVDSFGTDPNSQIKYIEISRSNPDVIYISQQPSSGNSGVIWKTTDAGQTWNQTLMPAASNRRKILLALDPEDENTLFAAFPQAGNGSKIFKTTDGGSTWTNLTSSVLDGQVAHSIELVGGTQNGIYFCSDKSVFYRDEVLGNWQQFATDLPVKFNSNIARAFYRDGKLRIASYGKGIWESEFHTPQSRPIATAMVDRFEGVCASDTFYFEDHSMLNHQNATWAWTFQGGNPAFSNLRNPAVTFSGSGQHLVTLTITDGNGQSSTDSLYISLSGVTATNINADFETAFPPSNFNLASTGNLAWTQNNSVGGYGLSNSCTMVDNYNSNGQGAHVDLRAYVNLSTIQNGLVTFDVAYAQYSGAYPDSLQVLVSTDCGLNFTPLYTKTGSALATAPNYTAGIFVPSATEWRTDSIDLSAYLGFGEVVIAFRNIANYGQALYLDNINIDGSIFVGLAQENQNYLQLAPNPVMNNGTLKLVSDQNGPFQIKLYDLQGKILMEKMLEAGSEIQISQMGLSAGQYYYMLSSPIQIKRGKVLVLDGRK